MMSEISGSHFNRRENMSAVSTLGDEVGIKKACAVLNVSRTGFYRWKSPVKKQKVRSLPSFALLPSDKEDSSQCFA